MYLVCYEIKLTPTCTAKLRLYLGSHVLYLWGCPYCTWIAINSPNYCVHGCAISPYQMPFLKLKLSREGKAINNLTQNYMKQKLCADRDLVPTLVVENKILTLYLCTLPVPENLMWRTVGPLNSRKPHV